MWIQFSSFKYIQKVVQPSQLSNPRTFSSLQKEMDPPAVTPHPTCPPGLGCEPRRLQEAQASSSVPYPLCCSEAQQLGREVIMKMENVVWPHDSASLTCLFAVSALHTLLLPPPVWRRLKKLSLQSGGEAKKSFPSPESQAGEERDLGIDLVSALVPPQ